MARDNQRLQHRIKSNIEVADNGCWDWLRHLNKQGYGAIGIGSRTDGSRRTAAAHRVSYEAFIGQIPDGLQIDHLCKNRKCVNPRHLEPVTCKENLHRGNPLWKQEAARTHCPQGHDYTEDNIYRGRNNSRNCKTCMKERSKARYWSMKMAVA